MMLSLPKVLWSEIDIPRHNISQAGKRTNTVESFCGASSLEMSKNLGTSRDESSRQQSQRTMAYGMNILLTRMDEDDKHDQK
jgi:hypothetical protein